MSSRTPKMMTIQGPLLIFVAIVHLAMTPEIAHIVSLNTTPQAFIFLWPPYALDHIVVGILLLPVGITTILLGPSVQKGVKLARRVALANAFAVLLSRPYVFSFFC